MENQTQEQVYSRSNKLENKLYRMERTEEQKPKGKLAGLAEGVEELIQYVMMPVR